MSTKVDGTKGNDVLYGADARHDHVAGKAGNDILFGLGDQDSVDGGEGNDIVVGGEGPDLLTGGLGRDTFVFHAGDGHDIIKDFKPGTDTLQFDAAPLSFEVHVGESSHWAAHRVMTHRTVYTTITYEGGQVDVVGIAGHALADFNL